MVRCPKALNPMPQAQVAFTWRRPWQWLDRIKPIVPSSAAPLDMSVFSARQMDKSVFVTRDLASVAFSPCFHRVLCSATKTRCEVWHELLHIGMSGGRPDGCIDYTIL